MPVCPLTFRQYTDKHNKVNPSLYGIILSHFAAYTAETAPHFSSDFLCIKVHCLGESIEIFWGDLY